MKALGTILLVCVLFTCLTACATPAPAPTTAPQSSAAPTSSSATPKATDAPKASSSTAAGTDPDVDKWLKAAELGPYAPAKQDWAAIEAAAKKEGKLVVYANSSKVADIKPLFEKKYPGITIEAPDMGGDEVLLKTREEQKAKNFYGDVFFSSSSAGDMRGELLPKQLIWNFVPSDLLSVIDGAYLTPILTVKLGVKVMAYNSELNKTCPIKNMWDMTDAAWKGKLFIEDPLNDASQMGYLVTIAAHPKELAVAYKEKFGKDPVLDADTPDAGWLWVKMLAKNKPIPEPGGDELTAAIASPKMKDSYIGINQGYSKYTTVQKGTMFFEPCLNLNPVMGLMSQTYLGIINRSQHPNAAKLFINFVTNTPEGFAPWNTMGSYSPRSDWAAAKGSIPFKDAKAQLWAVDEEAVYKTISKMRDFYALNLLK
jgi:iron(III) transport system substrate-binding protein